MIGKSSPGHRPCCLTDSALRSEHFENAAVKCDLGVNGHGARCAEGVDFKRFRFTVLPESSPVVCARADEGDDGPWQPFVLLVVPSREQWARDVGMVFP